MTPAENVELIAEARSAIQTGRGRTIREAASISQTEIAEAVGVSHSAVSLWEAGKRLPRRDTAVQYALVLRRLDCDRKA